MAGYWPSSFFFVFMDRDEVLVLKTEGTVFPNTDRPRPANNMFNFFLSGKLLYKKNLCRFFTEAVSHRARAFDVSVKQTRVVYRSI